MKNALLSLSFSFLIASAAGIYFSFFCNYQLLASGAIVASVLSGISILFVLKRYVNTLLIKANQVLNVRDEGSLDWFSKFKVLEENLKNIAKKFQLYAQLISNLTNPEAIDPVRQLGQDDAVGQALQRIKSEMQRIKSEDQKRAWITEGLARFAEIIKQRSEITAFGNDIISNLVKYMNVNQGGFFIQYENKNEKYLELVSCYAYSKQKFVEKRINEGQGLVGQCMFEKDFIFITDIPKDYVKITSGLGESTPRNIVVAPLIFHEAFCGVIELAAFQILQPHQIEFLKKVCTNIAAELVSLKNSGQTEKLLTESNMLAIELQEREQQMKVNLEELAATQDQMTRKQAELNGYLASVNNTIACVEFDGDARFIKGNEIFLKVMGYQEKELMGKGFDFFMGDDPGVVMMWENIRLGRFFSGEFRIRSKAGRELWLSGTFNPVVLDGKLPEKIIMLAQFTTQEKEKLTDLNAMVNALKSTLPVMEFNEDFVCKTANEKALQMFGLTRLQLRSKTILDFMAPINSDRWEKEKMEIKKKEFTNLVLPFISDSQILNYEVSVSLVRNHDGQIIKIIMLFVRHVSDWVPALAIDK